MLFWNVCGLICFVLFILVIGVYGGYYFYVSGKKRVNRKVAGFAPQVTVVLPTYNEEAAIEKKLENLCSQSYPTGLMEIIVIDSNSKDDTLKIVGEFMRSHPWLNVKIIKESERKGKSVAINKAFSAASRLSEIILMTDIDAILKENAIEEVVSRFSDQEIGAVSGMQVLLNMDESRETRSAGVYNRFWVKLRIGESAIDSTPVFSGEIAAYRASLISDLRLRENMNADDSQFAVMIRRKGYRSIRDPGIIYYEYAPLDWSSSQTQKVRRGQGLSRLLWYNKDMMFRKKYGKFGSIILPANFFAHLISPFLILFAATFGFIFLLGLVFQSQIGILVISGIFAIFIVDSLLFERKFTSVIWAFFEYQIILLKGILLFVSGRSLHKWKKVESIRTKFKEEIAINSSSSTSDT